MNTVHAVEVLAGAALLVAGSHAVSRAVRQPRSDIDFESDVPPTPEEIEEQAQLFRGSARYLCPWAWVRKSRKIMLRQRAHTYISTRRKKEFARWEKR